MHELRVDVAQDAGVVGDQQNPGVLGLGIAVDALADHAQSVDVKAGVGLVKDGDLRLKQAQLQDLVTLLLASGETLVDAALGELRIDLEVGHRGLHLFDPQSHLGCFAAHRGHSRAQEVRHRDTRYLHRVLHGQKEPRPGPFIHTHLENVLAVEGDRPGGDPILGVAGDRIGQRRLAGSVGAHDRMGLPRIHGQVDALEDLLLHTLRGVDDDVQVLDLQC